MLWNCVLLSGPPQCPLRRRQKQRIAQYKKTVRRVKYAANQLVYRSKSILWWFQCCCNWFLPKEQHKWDHGWCRAVTYWSWSNSYSEAEDKREFTQQCQWITRQLTHDADQWVSWEINLHEQFERIQERSCLLVLCNMHINKQKIFFNFYPIKVQLNWNLFILSYDKGVDGTSQD